ncbi:MAG: hypothetical protein JWM68_4631 [Verrucomicrobiales bacterium]|nr:hypothetical protein [Verrucomicrobiales bacterium]
MQNEWVLITGASSGIGLEFARLFATKKFDLVLHGRNEARLNEISRELTAKHSVRVKVLVRDLAQPAAASKIFAELEKERIPVSILVNNAGFGAGKFFAQEQLQVCTDMVETNITALIELTHLFLKPMLARKSGKILNVASTAAFQPGPKMAVYYASKAFVFSFSNALANELDGSGVTVTTLCPGPTRTEFHARAGATRSEKTIGKWMMTAEEVARAGYNGLMKGKRNVVPGLVNKIGVALAKIAPTRLSTAAARKVMEG